MRIKFLSMALMLFILLFSACSIYRAASQPPPADLAGIGIGTPRPQLILRLGPPIFSDIDPAGRKEESFQFYSGFHQASKARIILYLAGDILTLALAELIFWPLEMTVMDKATCTGFAVYDEFLKVSEWNISQKSGVQGC